MKQFNYIYKSKESFLSYLYDNNISESEDKILIQLFSSKGRETTQRAVEDICIALPNATLIGCSSAGEIIDSHSVEEEIVLSISIFEKTTIKSLYKDMQDSYLLGVEIAKELIEDKTKCIISFVDGLQHISEKYIKGIGDNNLNGTIISGGLAADLLQFQESFIIYNNKIYSNGAVAIALSGEELEVYNDYNLGRKAVGPTFTITKVKENRVYEINNKPTIEFYTEMLGEDIVRNMPASAIEFALLKEENGIHFARMLLKRFDDGSAIYTGTFHEGDSVRFSFGDLACVAKHNSIKGKEPKEWNFQAAFLYACVSKKEFLSFELEKAFPAVAKGHSVGFFSYGEFYSAKDAMLLNMASSLLLLHEKGTENRVGAEKKETSSVKKTKSTGSAILHLIDYVSANFQSQQKEFEDTKFKLDSILAAINSVIVISRTNPDGIITYANEGFEKISGYSKEELIGRSHNIVRDPKVKRKVFKKMWETIKQGKVWYGILSNRAKDGSIYYVKTHIFPIFDRENGRIVEYLAVREDVTKLEHTMKKIKEEKVAQAMFLANMAHEIRTPMNGIFGFTQLLEKSDLSTEQKKYVHIISNSTKTLLGLINDILDSSKIANNKLELEKITIDLHEELLMVHELLQSLAQEKQLKYKIKLDAKMSHSVKSDPTRLKQIITNLLSNAIKFTPKGGKVTLKTKVLFDGEDFQTIRFQVKDSGIGIAKEKQKSIFKPFTQAESGTTRKFGGTGLGLTISANLVKAFGGNLRVKSALHKGTTFFFDVKFKKSDVSEERRDSLNDAENNFVIDNSLNVLIAEDYDINRMLIEAIFKNYPNISYEFATDGEEAIEKAKNGSFDIIFMDINMPKCNGIEATKEIRKTVKNTPIIALTANAEEMEKKEIFEAGMNDYIAKPIEIEELQRVLEIYAPKKEPVASEEIVDFETLLKTIEANLGVDKETILPLFNAFVLNLEDSIKKLEDALKREEREEIINITHRLRGTAASFALEKVASILKEIEQEAKSGAIRAYAERIEALNTILHQLQKALANEL